MTFVDSLKFSSGLAFLDNFQVYVCPVNYFLTLFNYVYTNFSEDLVRGGLRNSSAIDMKILFHELNDSGIYRGKVLYEFLNRINNFGLGKIELVTYSDDKVIFSQKNPHLTGLYRNIFGEIPSVLVEEINLGFLMNFMSCFSGKKINGSLENRGNVLIYTIEILEEEFQLKNDAKYPEFNVGRVSPLVKKIILDKGVVVENGVFKMSGMVGVIIPYIFMFELFKNFKGEYWEIFLKSLGFVQGKATVDMHNHFGASLGSDCFNSILSLSDISGIGDIYLKDKSNFRNVVFKSNIFEDYSMYFSDEILDILLKHFHYLYQGGYDFCFNENTHLTMHSPVDVEFEFLSDDRKMTELEEEISKSLSTKILITNNN